MFGGRCIRVAAALLMTSPALATTPSAAWTGAKRVAVLCQVTSAPIQVENDAAARALCERVRLLAGRGSPVPVEIVGYGDPKLAAADTVALLVQASVVELGPRRLALLFTARTERLGGLEPAPTYFGAAPRLAPFTTAAEGAAWDGALATSLGEVLPWLQRGGNG